MQEFLRVKSVYESGFLSDDEYDVRRIQVIERMIQWAEGRLTLEPADDPILNPLPKYVPDNAAAYAL